MPPRPRPASRRSSEHDDALWAAYTRSIRPLPGKEHPAEPPAPSPPAAAPAVTLVAMSLPSRLPPRTISAPIVTGEAPAGLDRSSWNRFRTGRTAAIRTLDLHGKTVQAAYQALQRFMLAAHADHVRCVEIITGRGSGEHGGAIRRELPLWLNQAPLRGLVLAASHPHALNPGSTRLLLRKPKG